MSGTVKTVKQTCTCEKCGNESEMIVTCTLDESHEHMETAPSADQTADTASKQSVKGTATCTHCGNEADMWVSI